MDLVIIPSLFAICLKIAIFMRYHASLRKENFNLGMFFLAVFLLNIIELIALDNQFSASTTLILLLSFYCCSVFIIHAYLNLAIEYSKFNWHASKVKIFLNILLAFMVVSLIFDRSIIASVDTIGYAPTRIAGDSYWIYQVYALSGLAIAITLLVQGFRKLTSNLDRSRCFVVLSSTLAPVAVTSGVIGLMAAGYQVNAAVVTSLSLTLMLGILVYAEEKTRLFRMLTFIPFSKERKLHTQLIDQITNCISINDDPSQQNAINLKGMMKELEGSVVEHVLDYYGGNQKMTASALGVSEATVSRRARAVSGKGSAKRNNNYAVDSVRITQ